MNTLNLVALCIAWTSVGLTRVYLVDIGWPIWFRWVLFLREERRVPVATLVKKTERIDLTSCPGGYVIVRRMTYGEKLSRAELSGKMRILSNKVDKDAVGEINMMQKQVQLWEFANLILEHNLEHQQHTEQSDCYAGKCSCPIRPLNFKNQQDVELLAAQIGEEISSRMDKLNNFEEDEEVKNSPSGSAPESSSNVPSSTMPEKS